MRWRVIRSGNPDAEREHLNKILAEMQAEVERLRAILITNTGPAGPTGPTGPAGSGGGGGSSEGVIWASFDATPGFLETGATSIVYVPYDCQIIVCRSTGGFGESGSIEVDVRLASSQANIPSATSIVAAAPPTIVGTNSSIDSTLSGWTTTIPADSYLVFEITTVAAFTQCRIDLEVTKT